MNVVVVTIGSWTGAILGLLAIFVQIRKVFSRIADTYDFVVSAERKVTELQTSVTTVTEKIDRHIRNHPRGR
jgi:hypothetical protein